ncbi:MAG TPA: DUF6338 family protein [Vicinamibacterales bacterium]|jgi:hypothetical protein
MDVPSKTIIDVLTYLLPGFITAALVYNLTPVPRLVPFERVVQALIFTILVQVAVLVVRTALLALGVRVGVLGAWTEEARLVWSVLVAIGLGLSVAWATNTDRIHGLLRRCGITHQTSFSSEWYGALSQNAGFVVLHIKGERRLYGWPEEWPSTPDKGHFVVAQAEWLDGDNRIELTGVHRILVRADDVEMVELMRCASATTLEKPSGRS